MNCIVRLFGFLPRARVAGNFMKNEKKFLYALTRREAHAALDDCNRITADLPENLGIANAQFEACDRAAYALARPVVSADKRIFALTELRV
jgi:hypothetical protein